MGTLTVLQAGQTVMQLMVLCASVTQNADRLHVQQLNLCLSLMYVEPYSSTWKVFVFTACRANTASDNKDARLVVFERIALQFDDPATPRTDPKETCTTVFALNELVREVMRAAADQTQCSGGASLTAFHSREPLCRHDSTGTSRERCADSCYCTGHTLSCALHALPHAVVDMLARAFLRTRPHAKTTIPNNDGR